MQITNLFRTFCSGRLWLKVISAILVFLGFSSSVAAQYGAPYTVYQLNGQVKSSQSNLALQDVQMKIEPPDKSRIFHVNTDTTGNFGVVMRLYHSREQKWRLSIHDQVINNIKYRGIDTLIHVYRSAGDTNFIQIRLDELKTASEGKKENVVKINTELWKKENFEEPSPVKAGKKAGEAISLLDTANIFNKDAPGPGNWKLYPNPGSGRFTVQIESGRESSASVWIYDLNGKLCHAESFEIFNGKNERILALDFLAKGSYLLRLNFNGKIDHKKLIIQ